MKLRFHVRRFLRDERGVTALEYGILAAVVAVLIGTIVWPQLSSTMTSLFSKVTSAVSGVGA